MNGFVNSILSVMLSWIRALISNIWTLLNSEDGGALYRFLSSHWLAIVIGTCAVCVVVDFVVYFFRWRPDYVWATYWRRLRGRRAGSEEQTAPSEPAYDWQPAEEPAPQPESTMVYAPLQTAAAAGYAPVVQDAQSWQDMDEPVWDDAAFWEGDESADDAWEQPQQTAVYTAPRQETLTYYRDVQAGFAPAIPPEQLYAPSAGYQPPVEPEPEAVPVHPGLDEETFRQNLGLQEDAPPRSPVMRAPAFRPFTVTHEPREDVQPQGAFQRFAQKAREFVSMDDAEHRTIHDLQSTVDVSKAFHEPVYPQSFDHSEE